MTRTQGVLAGALVAGLVSGGVRAQMPPIAEATGEVGLALALRRLATTAVLMQATAPPDAPAPMINTSTICSVIPLSGHRV